MRKIHDDKVLMIIVTYLLFSMLFFELGFINWSVDNSLIIWLCFLILLTAIYVGYTIGFFCEIKIKPNKVFRSNLIANIIIPTCFLAHMVAFFYDATGGGGAGLDIAGNYYSRVNASASALGNPYPAYIAALTYPSVFLAMARYIVYGGKAYLFMIFSYLILYVVMATNSGVFDVLVIFPLIFIQVRRISFNRFTLPFILFLSIFFFLISLRLGDITLTDVNLITLGGDIDEDSVLHNLPSFLSIPLYMFNNYITQGYYHFDKLFEYNFDLCFLNGASLYLFENNDTLLLCDKSLAVIQIFKDQFGLNKWWSNFTWLIGGFGYYLWVLVVLVFSLLLGATSKAAMQMGSMVSVALFIVLVKFFIFFPYGNQLFQNAPNIISLCVTLFLFVNNHQLIVGKRHGRVTNYH